MIPGTTDVQPCMTAGAWVLIAAVVAALTFGLYRAATDGRFRGTRQVRTGSVVEERGSASVVEERAQRASRNPHPLGGERSFGG